MLARRNFVYKRSHNGAHLKLAARDSPKVVNSQVNSPSSSSSDPSLPATTTDPLTSLTPVAPAPKTTETPTIAPSSSPTSSSSTPATSTSTPSSSSSSSSTAPSSSTPTSSSASRTTSSTASIPLIASPATTYNALPATTHAVTAISFTPTSTLAPATTSSAGSTSGTNTDAIIGGVAGTLVGIALLGFLLMWCMRRQRSRDIDDFDAQAFKRQSAILVDDQPHQSYNPRPPTMIERHNASPALAAQSGFGGQNFYGSFGGYGQQSAYPPPEMVQPSVSPPQQAYAAPPMGYAGYADPRQQIARQPSNVGYADYDSQQQLARQPSNAEYLTRQPSSYAPPTAPPSSNAHYIDLNRSSISPYQAAQYADISRQLGTTNPDEEVPHESHELPDGPLPSPFDDPAEATLVPDLASHVHPVHPSNVVAPGPVTTPGSQPHRIAPALHQRPTTLYEEGDAYGGF